MSTLIEKCNLLLDAYKSGKLGQTVMPEDTNPGFKTQEKEQHLAYFSLPMALNYQRNSYKLWEAALATYRDPETRIIFDITQAAKLTPEELRVKLTRYKLALQPNKHIDTWQRITQTISSHWGAFTNFIEATNNDFLLLKTFVQQTYKKGFPYLSGDKIFNYWSFILMNYCNIPLTNAEFIDIAPDTHITKCSVKLGVITEYEAEKLTKAQISEKWRNILKGSGISPIQMHPPLWFWSRNGFLFRLDV